MSASVQPVAAPRPVDRPAIVTRHKCYRGLRVEQDLMAQFTMYILDMDQFGLFISDSRPQAFDMAFDALFSGASAAQA